MNEPDLPKVTQLVTVRSGTRSNLSGTKTNTLFTAAFNKGQMHLAKRERKGEGRGNWSGVPPEWGATGVGKSPINTVIRNEEQTLKLQL